MDQNELRRKALMDQMGGNTGIAGVPDVSKLAPPPAAAAPAPLPASPQVDASLAPPTATAHDYGKLGQFSGQMGAWSEGDPNKPGNEKFARPWDDRSERYQMLSVLSNFDPTKGITPEALDALNKANIHGAKFSGSGDKLTVDNAGNWDRFGKGGTADIIQGLKSGHGTWSPWSDPALEAQGAQQQGPQGQMMGGALPSFGGAQLDAALSGDPLAKIQQAIAQMSGSRQNFDALLAQLGGQ